MSFRNTCWFLGIAMGGAIGAAVSLTFALGANSAEAQITPDGSLGAESSVVTPNVLIKNVPSDRIDGGAIRGANLFHSFQEFNINAGRGAYFSNPAGIANILTRVTGGNVSNIQGVLGVLGNANLFFINPNGIIFGPNASLDVGGSFVGTTANAIQFGNQGFFSASAPNNPALLTVNPSALFFNQIAAAARIENNSVANAGLNPSSTFTATGLRVQDGRSLLLVGGDINMDGGGLFAFGGRVELGGLRSAGTVGLNGDGNNLSLSFPDNVERSDVSLSNGAQVNVRAGDGGSIAVYARNLEMTGESGLFAGIGRGLGSSNSKAGNISVNAQGTLNLKDSSNIRNLVQSGATGQAGDITITTGSLTLTNGSELDATTYGRGNAGNVNIDARDTVSFDRSNALSSVQSTEVGKGGDITIKTGSLALTNGAELIATTYGRGDAGNVNIDARDTVEFVGRGSDGLPSGAFSNVLSQNAVGNGGVINIKTGSLYLSNGAVLNAGTYNEGNAGNIDINTGSLALTNGAQLITSTYGRGDAGSVNIKARERIDFDRGFVFSTLQEGASGKGGDINIDTGSLALKNGAELVATSYGLGDAGNVNIIARDTVLFDGVNNISRNRTPSGAFSNVESQDAVGNAGNISITTGSLYLRNGAVVNSRTRGQGNGGSVNIIARETVSFDRSNALSPVELTGVGNAGEINITTSFLTLANDAQLTTSTNGQGKSGDININTGSLTLTNGGELVATTYGRGDAGNVKIYARNTVSFDGRGSTGYPSGAFSNVLSPNAVGNGGDINIKTGSLYLRNGAVLNAATYGQGNGGNVNIHARETVSFDRSSSALSSVQPTGVGKGGDINIKTGSLALTNGSELRTTTSGQGNAGNVNIKARDTVSFDGSNARSTVESTGVGKGGDINITSRKITLDNSGRFIAESASGNAGDIKLTVNDLLLMRGGAQISTTAGTAQKGGNGGNIEINTHNGFIVAFPGENNNDITANAYNDSAGKVQIKAAGIYEIKPLSRDDLERMGALDLNPRNLLTNDITAVSQQGGPQLDGRIFINDPNADLSNSFVSLPADVFDPTNQIAQGCSAFDQANASDFKVTGRGGLPPSPDEPLSSDAVWEDTRLGATTAQRLDSKTTATKPKSESDTVEIIPATGWVFNGKGEVTLVSQTPNATVENLAASSQSCRVR